MRHCRCESTRSSVGVSLSMHVHPTPTCTHAFIHAWQQQNTVGTKVFCFIALACDRSTSDSISALMPWPDVNLDLLAPPPHHPRCDAWPTAVRPPTRLRAKRWDVRHQHRRGRGQREGRLHLHQRELGCRVSSCPLSCSIRLAHAQPTSVHVTTLEHVQAASVHVQ